MGRQTKYFKLILIFIILKNINSYKEYFPCAIINKNYKDFIMTAKVKTDIYLDSDITIQAKEIFKKYGVSLSDAINMFLTQSVLEKGLPFEIKTPNDETIQAIKDARANKNGETITLAQLEEESKQCLR